MAQKSSIKTLPDDLLASINKMIVSGDWTIDQIVDTLKSEGHTRSRSAVGRYKKDIESIAEKLRENRQIADALIAEIGESATDGKHGRMLIEVTRSLVFDFQMALMDGKQDSLTPQQFMNLAKAIKDLSAAMRQEQDFEEKIRVRIAAEERENAANAVSDVAAQSGLDADQVAAIRGKILGVPVNE